jgi:hypothetical protein
VVAPGVRRGATRFCEIIIKDSRGAGSRGRGAGGMEKEPIKSHEDLEVYKMAFDVAMKIFELSRGC